VAIFGYNVKGATELYPSGNYLRACRFYCPNAGRAVSITMYAKQYSTYTPKIKYALYSDNNGVPASLVGYTEEWTLTSGWDGWKTLNIISGGVLSPAYYWITWFANNNAYQYYDAGDTNQYYYVAYTYDSFPSTMPTGGTYSDRKYSRYCTYIYTQTVSEALGLTDSVAKQFNAIKTVSDILGLTDSALKPLHAKELVAEALGLSDSAARTLEMYRVAAEVLGMSDQMATRAAFKRSISDLLGLLDSAMPVRVKPVTVADILWLRDKLDTRKHVSKIGDLPDHTITGGAP
jgi:hypothetical protein